MRLNGYQGVGPWALSSFRAACQGLHLSVGAHVEAAVRWPEQAECKPSDPIPRLLASEELTFHRGVECFPEVWSSCSGSVGIWFLPLALLLCCKLNPPQFTPQWALHGERAASPSFSGVDAWVFWWTSSKAGLRCTLVFQISHRGSWTTPVGNWQALLCLWVWKRGETLVPVLVGF